MKIVGMVAVYNDEDIIKKVLEDLAAEDIDIIVVDGGSQDNTFKICKELENQELLKTFQVDTVSYEPELVLRILYDYALRESPDWIIRCDADEFLSSYKKGITLRDAITQVDSEGYNIIQFDRFDFFMTDNDPLAESIKDKMPYYSYIGDFVYRAWKFYPGINICGDYGGHFPVFPSYIRYKIFPKKFILRHYPLRSKQQSIKKMKGITRGRAKNVKDDSTFDNHFRKVLEQDYTRTFNHRVLTRYEKMKPWNYEIALNPYADANPPKKEDIFSDDGILLKHQRGLLEYKSLLEYYKNQKWYLRIIRKIRKLVNSILVR